MSWNRTLTFEIEEDKNILIVKEFKREVSRVDIDEFIKKKINKHLSENKEEILESAKLSQKEELERLKTQLTELMGKAKFWKENSNKWINHIRQLEAEPLKKILTEEQFEEILKKSLKEIKEEKKKYNLEFLENLQPKSQIPFEKEGYKTTKQIIIDLLRLNESLEEKFIIQSLEGQGIPEGTTRQALYRERDKLFQKNKLGEWELRH